MEKDADTKVFVPPAVTGKDERERYHYLDASRAFALILGIFWHGAESFGAQNTYWAAVDCSPGKFLDWFRFGSHSFRMELFFLIAGFFARFLLVRRGLAGFVQNRACRIAIPFIAGWVLLYPVVVSLWLWGWSITHRLGDLGIPLEDQHLAIWKLCLDFSLSGGFLKKFGLIHLWFLYQLLIIYVLVLGASWLAGRFRALSKTVAWLDKAVVVIDASIGIPFCLSLWAVPLLLSMNVWIVDTPNVSLVPYWPTTFLYCSCFLVGWLFHKRPPLLEKFKRRWIWYLIMGGLLWASFIEFGQSDYLQIVPESQTLSRIIFEFVYANMMWAFVFGFLGLFARFFQRSNPWIRYVSDASYWIYIVHFPVIIALQVWVSRIQQPWFLKYGFIMFTAFAILFLSYHYLVRSTFIGVLLSGRKYSRAWPWQMEKEFRQCS